MIAGLLWLLTCLFIYTETHSFYTENELISNENLRLNMTDYLRILQTMLSWGHEVLYWRVYLL